MPKNALARVLLDFGRTPGRYALRLREPAELHAQIDTLALWALGRVPEGLQAQAQEIKAAAVMFIQRACFAPENNHYQILGLPQGPVDAELLRTRYRALIRLTHPDMGVEGLPANAAGLVNRAQKVLADPALRERYDQELENDAWPRWRTAPPVAAAAGAPLVRKPEPHWAAPKGRLGVREGWSALWARYPLQARLLLTATGVGALVLALLAWLWRPLLAITVHEELARVEGLPVAAIRLALMLLIAVVIAVAMKIVGVLLITSLLIIPAAAAQRHSRTPEQMAIGASLLGLLAVGGGLSMSWFEDTPAGPSIVVCAAGLFLLSLALPRRTA